MISHLISAILTRTLWSTAVAAALEAAAGVEVVAGAATALTAVAATVAAAVADETENHLSLV